MKNGFKILFAVMALGLLAGAFGVAPALAKQADKGGLGQLDASYAPQAIVAPADGNVEWAASDGEDISFVSVSTTAVFFINDDALETTKAATAEWIGFAANQGDANNTFDIAAGTVNGATTTSFTLTATAYDTTTPANTPLTSAPTVTVGGTTLAVAGFNANAGTFTLLTAAAASTTASFSYHIQDVWSSAVSVLQRAKVVTTSDPAGEYVTISEVVAVGSNTADPTSQIFRGDIVLTSDAAKQGTNGDGVWVQDGDTVTVKYLKSDGTTLDSDTVTADGVNPTISNVTPAPGAITNLTSPTINVDVTDTGSGISLKSDGTTLDSDTVTADGVNPTISNVTPAPGAITNLTSPTINVDVTDTGSGISATDPGSAVTITIMSGTATTTIGSKVPAFQTIADGFRVIFAQGTSWLSSNVDGGFNVLDSTQFSWKITAKDVAGNQVILTLDLTIDITKPDATAAQTGTSFDVVSEAESTDDNTAVRVTLNEDLDASSVQAADFTVAGVAPSAAIVGTAAGFKDKVYLTVPALAPDARPEVKVVAEIKDLRTTN